MKLYDPKFVHFEWSDELDGKCCFVADHIGNLKKSVNENDTTRYGKVSKADEYSVSPFSCDIKGDNYNVYTFVFAYYDPNYEVKYAYWEMGYDIYYKLKDKNCDWEKVSDNTNFLYVIDDPDYEFKVDDFDNCDELAYKLSVQLEFHKGNTVYYRNKTHADSEWHPFSKATAGKDYCFDFSTYQYMMENKNKFITAEDLEETINKLREQLALRYSLEDKIKDLEQQIEKMKICWNCKFEDTDYMEEPCSSCSRSLGDIKRKGTSDKWEIKEND